MRFDIREPKQERSETGICPDVGCMVKFSHGTYDSKSPKLGFAHVSITEEEYRRMQRNGRAA